MICFLLITIFRDKTRRKQQFVKCIALTSVLSSIAIFIPTLFPFEKAFCRNSSVGLSEYDGISMCVVQGACLLYSLLSTCLGCSLQALELYAKVVHNWSLFPNKRWCIIGILTLPLISVVVVAVFGSFGYAGNFPWCFTIN